MSIPWLAVVGLSTIGSVGGLLVASALLAVGEAVRRRVVPWLVSYAAGALLGAALLSLLPEALDALRPRPVFLALLAGILTFFILEKLVLWHHGHDDAPSAIHAGTVTLVVIGDTVHAFVDGAVIAASTLLSLALGTTTALAVTAHEVPHRAGDFGIMLSAGHSRPRALLLSLASAVGGLAGALAMVLFGTRIPHVIPYVLGFAAGNFLYIAMADLIPSLHHGDIDPNAARQVVLIALGVATIAAL